MSDLNRAMIIGRLGKDPETQYLDSGVPVTRFAIATGEKWKDKKTGETRERTEWHRVVTFNRLAEICAEYLTKGKQIYVEGKLQTRSWEQDGTTRYMTEIVATSMQMLGGGQQSQGNPSKGNGARYDDYHPPTDSADDMDIPF